MYISSVESQKGAVTIDIDQCYLLVLNGTSLNSVNALLALSWQYYLKFNTPTCNFDNKRVQNLAVSREPWDISEVIRDKHRINKSIPGLGPQKTYSSVATSAQQLRRLVYLGWPLTDACANEIPNSLIDGQSITGWIPLLLNSKG